MKVTLAIPNYNGAANLAALLSRVLQEDFDNIYVLDDCSTDNSLEVILTFGDNIKIVKGEFNLGAGGNRNRIIDHVKDGIIMFLDADMELITNGVVEKVANAFTVDDVSVVGGLILNNEDTQMNWNFGPLMHPSKDAQAYIVSAVIAEHFSGDKESLAYLASQVKDYAPSWNIFHSDLIEREVGWVAEGNFCVRADVFNQVGGYDEAMRYHETHDLNKRVQDAGGKTIFRPSIVAKHLDIDVRGEARAQDQIDAQFYYFQKHWGMNRQVFNRLYDLAPNTNNA